MEPVLLVPRHQTECALSFLIAEGCVPRRWHLEGRYGSRIFAHGDGRMGLPLLSQAATQMQDGQSLNEGFSAQLCAFLTSSRDVEIVYMTVPLPKFVTKLAKQQQIDATVHADRRACIPLPIKQRDPDRITHSSFTFVDLFCGIGGFAVALQALGGQCLFACDIDDDCRHMYLQNVHLPSDDCFHHGDINDISDSALPDHFDLLVAGFPCQPFSSLGQQPGLTDPFKGLLYTQIIRFLKARQPRAFLLENVPGLAQTQQAMETIIADLQLAGYNVFVEVCSARGLTAQSRKRLFFVGFLQPDRHGDQGSTSLETLFEFPYIPDLGLRAADVIEFNYYCEGHDGDMTCAEATHQQQYDRYRLTDAQMNQLLSRRPQWKAGKLAWPDCVCDTLIGHYGATKGKGNSQLVPCPAPLNPRCFTPRECARLMGFPMCYQIASSCTTTTPTKKLYQMFGNSVCPPLIAVLTGAVLHKSFSLDTVHDAHNDDANPHIDWRLLGLEAGIAMAIDALLPPRQDAIVQGLHVMGVYEKKKT